MSCRSSESSSLKGEHMLEAHREKAQVKRALKQAWKGWHRRHGMRRRYMDNWEAFASWVEAALAEYSHEELGYVREPLRPRPDNKYLANYEE